jgi:hypothetical protein
MRLPTASQYACSTQALRSKAALILLPFITINGVSPAGFRGGRANDSVKSHEMMNSGSIYQTGMLYAAH